MKDKKRIIAVYTSRIFDAQQHSFLRQLSSHLAEINCAVVIYCTNTDLYWQENEYFPEAEIFRIVPMDSADLIIVMDEKIKCRRISHELIRKAKAQNKPVLAVDGEYKDACCVKFDYSYGFEQVVRHIIEHHGAKKPHFMAGIKGNAFSDERIAIFRKVAAENGLPCSDDTISYGEFWAEPARKAMQRIIDSGDLPDAVICANDIMAINVTSVIIEAGLRVPEDIMVSGFDGIDEAALCTPKITTASCGSDALAESVFHSIKDCLDGNVPNEISVIPKFMPNDSCGCSSCEQQSSELMSRFNNSFYRYQDDIRFMFDISTKIQMSKTPMEAAVCMSHPMLKGIRCFTFSSCLEQESDFFASPLLMSERSKFNTFYDSEGDIDPEHSLSADELSHQIAEIATVGLPTVINVLDYLSKPMGVICYSFENFNIVECSKTASITNTISMGLGGFITSRYQRFLFERVEEMYRIDPLTGLFNRSGFNNEFAKLSENTDNKGRPITVIMADLDGLKFINDTYGHESGDVAIASAAKVLSDCCPDKSLCVRFGGDEMFAVMLGDCCPEKIIGEIETKLEKVNKQEHNGFPTMLSCGAYTTVLDDSFDLSSALKQADEKMYSNKRSRKNKYMNI